MKNKSIVLHDKLYKFFKTTPQWGELLFESYWKRDIAGNIQESTPTTSEFLEGFLWPYEFIINDNEITLNGEKIGFKIEQTTAAGVHIERVVYKPLTIPDQNKIELTPIKFNILT